MGSEARSYSSPPNWISDHKHLRAPKIYDTQSAQLIDAVYGKALVFARLCSSFEIW